MNAVVEAAAIAQVRESVAVARSHGEKFFEQIVWQVETEAWKVLGYDSWDAMRKGEYGDLGIVAPRADRPELVARLRAKGLTQKSIAATVGISQQHVSRLNTQMSNEDAPETVTNSRGQSRPATYATKTRHIEETIETFDAATGEVLSPVDDVIGKMRDAYDQGLVPEPEVSGVEKVLDADDALSRSSFNRAFQKSISLAFLQFDAQRVAEVGDDDVIASLDGLVQASADFAKRVHALRDHGLRLIQGGRQ